MLQQRVAFGTQCGVLIRRLGRHDIMAWNVIEGVGIQHHRLGQIERRIGHRQGNRGEQVAQGDLVAVQAGFLTPEHQGHLLHTALFLLQLAAQLLRRQQYLALMTGLGTGTHHQIDFGAHCRQIGKFPHVFQHVVGTMGQDARRFVAMSLGVHHPQTGKSHGFQGPGGRTHVFRHRRFHQHEMEHLPDPPRTKHRARIIAAKASPTCARQGPELRYS